MRPEDFEQFRKIARDLQKLRPSIEQMQGLRHQTESARKALSDPSVREAYKWLSDPAIQKWYADTARIVEMRNQALTQMPDAATQRAITEAARYFESSTFLARKDAVLQTAQVARQRLGPEGLAAAGRVAARRSSDDGSQEQGAERIRAGQATALLEEATQLAASPEVREAVEQVDPIALLRLDQEEGAEPLSPEPQSVEPRSTEPYLYDDEHLELNKEGFIGMHNKALILLLPLEVAFVSLALLNPAAPILASLALAVGGLISFLLWSKEIVSRREN